MTSPGVDVPSRKTKEYEEVHGRGSSFGQNLNEAKVRELLGTEVQSPFAKFLIGIGDRFAAFAGDIAQAIKGEGAKYTMISGAVDERLGPLDTAISESGERMRELSDKVAENTKLQEQYRKESQEALEESRESLATAEQAIEDLAAADAERRLKVEGLVSQAEQFTKRADEDAKALEAYKQLQKQRVDELAGTAEDALSRAAKIMDDQGQLVGELKQARDDASDAVSKLTVIDKRWQSDITNAVQGLVSKAQLEAAKAEAANEAAKDIQASLKDSNSDVAKSVDALVSGSQAVKSAADEARGAAQALESYTDIGGSFIALVPGTQEPSWSSTQPEAKPSGSSYAHINGKWGVTNRAVESMQISCPERWVAVSDKIRYKVSFWVYGTSESQLLISAKAKEYSGHAIETDREKRVEPTKNHDDGINLYWRNGWLVGITGIDNSWRRVEYTFQFKEGTQFASFNTVHWAYAEGGPSPNAALQWIVDLRIEPEIPDQATIDRLQTNAILKNEKVGSTNATAIQVMEKSWEAQKIVNDKQQKWNTAATEAREANTAAAKSNTQAIKALARIDTGSSLVLYEDLTDEEIKEVEDNKRPLQVYKPSWATAATVRMPKSHPWIANHPVINEAWGVGNDEGTKKASINYAKVEPGMVYKLSYWHRAGVAGARYYIQMQTPKGEEDNVLTPLTPKTKTVDGKRVTEWVEGNPTSYAVVNEEMPVGKWEKVERRFRVLDDASQISFSSIYWNHPNGSATASQYIANMEFSLDVPTQADVDSAQNQAIEALDKEAKLNKEFREEQIKLEKEQKRIDLAQNRALRALNRSDSGSNVIPVWSSDDAPVGETLPAWAANASGSSGNDKIYPGFRYRGFKGTAQPGSLNKVAVDASLEYDFTVWLHGTNSSKLFIELRDQDGNHAVESGGIAAYTRNYSKGTVTRTGKDYLVNGCTLLNGWTKLTSRITLKPGTRYVYVGAIYGNHSSGPNGAAYIGEDMSLTPHVPSQEEIDRVQNRAIEANSKAIRALARIDTGSSLVLYEDLTDEEVAKAAETGVIPRPTKPSWATATNTYLGPTHGMIKGSPVINEAWGVNANTSTLRCRHNFAKVEPGMVYKLSYWHRAGNGGSKYYIQMQTPKGEENNCLIPLTPVEKTVNGKKVTEWKEGNPTSYAVVGEEMPPYKWVKVEKRFRILEDVSQITFHAFYWNHPSGSSSQAQYIANMEFSLDVPTQEDVDKAQSEAIEALQVAQEANEKHQEAQERTNRLVQNQVWVHQDMIELLDIRTPKLYGWTSYYHSSSGWSKSECPYSSSGGDFPYQKTPFFEIWEVGGGKNGVLYVAARGQWTGWMHVSINWDSGVVDDWAIEINSTKRIARFTGGAAHINRRSISVEVYPRSLNRKGTIILYDDGSGRRMDNYSGDTSREPKTWNSIGDTNRLFRHALTKRIRLKNTVTCNRNVWVRNEEGKRYKISAGNNIYAAEIYPEDQDYANNTIFTFTEVDDPVRMDESDRFGYKVDETRPTGTAITYTSRSA